jgi:predicted RNA-binding protein associated with RNAse of E/G family
MSKERDMRRTDWKRITKRRYFSREEADIFGSAGRISLTLIDEVTGPLTVHYKSRAVLIADAGYSWFQAAVPGARWWLTAMFDECDRLIQIYFDITGGSRFDDPENPTFEDMYLDIVVSADGSIEVVDRDELDEALQSGAITVLQHREAIEACEKLERFLRENTTAVLDWCSAMQRKLKREMPV